MNSDHERIQELEKELTQQRLRVWQKAEQIAHLEKQLKELKEENERLKIMLSSDSNAEKDAEIEQLEKDYRENFLISFDKDLIIHELAEALNHSEDADFEIWKQEALTKFHAWEEGKK